MARFQACLLDAYGTILSCDFSAYRTELPVLAGIAPEAMDAEFRRLEPAVTDGRLSLSQAYARIMQACGAEPEPGRVVSVADKSRELLLASARLYDDVLPFLRTLRSRGVKTAIVSNCDENTRDLLVELGVAALADALVLSCEVIGPDRPGPLVFLVHLAVPGGPVMRDGVKVLSHRCSPGCRRDGSVRRPDRR
jgi:putative hydrolase of the HAD superfamily